MAAPASIRTPARTAFARIIAHCKRIGTAKFGIQLAHAGRKASSARPWEGGLGLKPGSGSVGDDRPVGDRVRAPLARAARRWTEADMAQVREAFVNAAKRALRVGFDTIELHMAHGYLMHASSRRSRTSATTRYGGSISKGRMKFPLEVLRAVRAVVPKDYAARRAHLGGRLDGWRPDRRRLRSHWVAAMKESGLDFVDASRRAA